MAKQIVKFDNNEYSIDKSKFDPAIEKLVNYFSTELAGTGVTLTIGGVKYNLDGTRVSEASNVLADFAEDNAGTGRKMRIGGTEYEVSEAKLASAVDTMNYALNSVAESEEPDLPASEGLEFELNDDGQSYYVSGIGTCTDNEVVIPSYYKDLPVTDIYVASKGRGPLNKENVYSIVLPNTFTKISNSLFSMYVYLKSVTIPGSVTSIDDYAFMECSSLTSVTIPDSVTSIGENAFSYCGGLTSIEIPNSVTSIGDNAFFDSTHLTAITFEGTVVEWNTIEKGEYWIWNVPATYVQCIDGQVAL